MRDPRRRRATAGLLDRRGRRSADDHLSTMQVLEKVASVVAPVSILTALLIYVGFVRTTTFFRYFGIRQQLLNLSVQDYALRSVDGSFGAAIGFALAGVLVLALDHGLKILGARLNGRGRVVTGSLMLAVGLSLVTSATSSALTSNTVSIVSDLAGSLSYLGQPIPLIEPAGLAVGVIAVLRGVSWIAPQWARSRLRILGVTRILGTVVAAFWAASHLAEVRGIQAAATVESAPSNYLPRVTVTSPKPLDFTSHRVARTVIGGDKQDAARYRYTGLLLLTYANRHWFLIADGTPEGHRPPVAILNDSDSIIVEVEERK